MTEIPAPLRVSTTDARDQLSAIITRVQDPRAFCILTRHGKSVAAIVSMAEMKRIMTQQDIEDISAGRHRPVMFRLGRGGHMTNAEAAEAVQKAQLDRRMEREVLATAGLQPVPGGELVLEAEPVHPEAPPGPTAASAGGERRAWWRFWR